MDELKDCVGLVQNDEERDNKRIVNACIYSNHKVLFPFEKPSKCRLLLHLIMTNKYYKHKILTNSHA